MNHYQLLLIFAISSFFVSMTSSIAFGQAPPSMKEISGKYVNDQVGVEIVFPDGWTGMTIGLPEGSMATVSPGGIQSMDKNSFTTLTLMTSEKIKTDSPPTSFDNQGKSKCKPQSTDTTTIDGVSGTVTIISCTNEDGTAIKLKTISVGNKTHWIVVSFMASVSDYDNYIGKFDDSVKTLKIQNAISVPEQISIPPVNLQSSTVQIMIKGNPLELTLQSSSQLSNIGLDEEKKTLSFSTVGDNDGITVVPVGNVLDGEFVVTVDRQITKDFQILDEQGVQTLKLKYPSGSHDISISGTRVVPEFGTITVLILAISIMSIITISTKSRLV